MHPTDFPLWLRVSHFINFVFIGLLIRSGIEILAAHPRLYWNEGCTPRSDWLRFTKKQVPTDSQVIHTAHDEEIDLSPWIALPGHKNLGLGRHWHGISTAFWILNGIVYVILLFATGEWTRLIPTSWDIFPRALHSLTEYLTFQIPPASEFQPYDPLQQLTYAGVVFLLGPFLILTGAAMSPAIAARFPGYVRLFGGRQRARSFHFLGLVAFLLFTILHTMLVLVVHFQDNVTNIVLGQSTADFGLAVVLAILGLAVIVAIHVWITRYSLRHKRQVQMTLDKLENPVRKLLLQPLPSVQNYKEKDISPYFWVNGAPPLDTESPTFIQLAEGHFHDWYLDVGGMVQHPLHLSLADLQTFPKKTQITLHNCVQGWSGIGKWAGLSLAELLDRCQPLPGAHYVMVISYGLDQFTYGNKPRQPFYEAIDLALARHPQTILAYEFNDAPLPLVHGAPLRLRVETQLGYKMVKYIRAIELIADYRAIGEGQGGSREDTMFYGRGAEI